MWNARIFLVSMSLLIGACGGETLAGGGGDGGSVGSVSGAIGAACVPVVENETSYSGGTEQEVSIESPSPQCGGQVCLMNHFRGRVSCPYGQDATGTPPTGANACTAPSSGKAITGTGGKSGAAVAAQCADRRADRAVYCSCRCANMAGRTDDGASYCACPQGFSCTQLVASISSHDDVGGAYCIKAGTAYDPASSCEAACDPQTSPCP